MTRSSTAAATASDLALLVLGTARASRFLTSDTLGDWTVDAPARRWALRHDGWDRHRWPSDDPAVVASLGAQVVDPDRGWRSKAVTGLECPFCSGFWLAVLNCAAYAASARHKPLRRVWRAVNAPLALNYVTGHVSSRLD